MHSTLNSLPHLAPLHFLLITYGCGCGRKCFLGRRPNFWVGTCSISQITQSWKLLLRLLIPAGSLPSLCPAWLARVWNKNTPPLSSLLLPSLLSFLPPSLGDIFAASSSNGDSPISLLRLQYKNIVLDSLAKTHLSEGKGLKGRLTLAPSKDARALIALCVC